MGANNIIAGLRCLATDARGQRQRSGCLHAPLSTRVARFHSACSKFTPPPAEVRVCSRVCSVNFIVLRLFSIT